MTVTATIPTDAYTACRRYDEIRHRLVNTRFAGPPPAEHHVENLAQLRAHIDVFVLDGFGVLNLGEKAIPGAAGRVAGLRASGAKVLVLTNGATLPGPVALAKYQSMGMTFTEDDFVSSRQALAQYLSHAALDRRWGFAATEHSNIAELTNKAVLLRDDPATYDAAGGFVLLSTAQWNPLRQHLLLESLAKSPRPILVGNPDLVAPRGDSLSLEPGFYAHQIADVTGSLPHFFGKPFQNVFDIVRQRIASTLGRCPPERIAMVGDTLHTDILGGAAAGWRTVLVTGHGLMRGLDVDAWCASSGIYPDFIAQTT